jgi:hypothetical protein
MNGNNDTYKQKSNEAYQSFEREISSLEMELYQKEQQNNSKLSKKQKELLERLQDKIRRLHVDAEECGLNSPKNSSDFYKNKYQKIVELKRKVQAAKKGIESLSADSDVSGFEKVLYNMDNVKQNKLEHEATNALDGKIANYLNRVTGKLSERKPAYYSTTKGNVLNKKKNWKRPELDIENQMVALSYVVGEHERAKLQCKHEKIPSYAAFVKKANALEKTGKFIAECYMVTKADEKTKEFVEDFSSKNYLVYIYETSHGGSLYYNRKDTQTQIFSAYFDPKKKPKNLKGIFKENTDDEGKLTKEKIDSLNFKDTYELEYQSILMRVNKKYVVI